MNSHTFPSERDDDEGLRACFHRLVHRLQISIDEERLERVAVVARARGASMASVIRDVIDIALDGDPERRRAAEQRRVADDLRIGKGEGGGR
jgi:hypothetical protein